MDCLLYKKWLSRVGQSMKSAKSQIVWRICVCSNYVTSVGVCQLTDINSLKGCWCGITWIYPMTQCP